MKVYFCEPAYSVAKFRAHLCPPNWIRRHAYWFCTKYKMLIFFKKNNTSWPLFPSHRPRTFPSSPSPSAGQALCRPGCGGENWAQKKIQITLYNLRIFFAGNRVTHCEHPVSPPCPLPTAPQSRRRLSSCTLGAFLHLYLFIYLLQKKRNYVATPDSKYPRILRWLGKWWWASSTQGESVANRGKMTFSVKESFPTQV